MKSKFTNFLLLITSLILAALLMEGGFRLIEDKVRKDEVSLRNDLLLIGTQVFGEEGKIVSDLDIDQYLMRIRFMDHDQKPICFRFEGRHGDQSCTRVESGVSADRFEIITSSWAEGSTYVGRGNLFLRFSRLNHEMPAIGNSLSIPATVLKHFKIAFQFNAGPQWFSTVSGKKTENQVTFQFENSYESSDSINFSVTGDFIKIDGAKKTYSYFRQDFIKATVDKEGSAQIPLVSGGFAFENILTVPGKVDAGFIWENGALIEASFSRTREFLLVKSKQVFDPGDEVLVPVLMKKVDRSGEKIFLKILAEGDRPLYIIHPYRGFSLNPLYAGDVEGFANHPFDNDLLKKNPNEVKIGVFGGSVVLGLNASHYSKNLVSLLQNKFDELSKTTGKVYRVINFGVGAYRQPQQFFILSEYADRLDAVINFDGYNEISIPAQMRKYPLHFPWEFIWVQLNQKEDRESNDYKKYFGLALYLDQLRDGPVLSMSRVLNYLIEKAAASALACAMDAKKVKLGKEDSPYPQAQSRTLDEKGKAKIGAEIWGRYIRYSHALTRSLGMVVSRIFRTFDFGNSSVQVCSG